MNSAAMLLEEVTKKYGTKIGMEDEFGTYTFAQWRDTARRLGTALLQKTTEEGISPVVIYMPKSAKSVMSFFAAQYSGNPYVPCDEGMPIERFDKIIENLQPGHIITNEEYAKKLESCHTDGIHVHIYDEIVNTPVDDSLVDTALSKVIDTDPIYIMYTSGSTGTPKGVVIPHCGVLDYAKWVNETFSFDEETIIANQASFFFDNSVLDIYATLYSGAKLTIVPEILFRFPQKLPDYINENKINTIFWVPTVLIEMANSGVLAKKPMESLKKILFCGEVMPNKQLNIWRKSLPDALYANLYGPTEITDVCSYYVVDRAFDDLDPLPIGGACRNMRIEIINEAGNRCAVGEQGELCILGSGVALGYWNAKDISDKVFVQNPLNTKYQEKMYRTGDLAYWSKDGVIIFIGRCDNQIKLKGNRIELGEIENAAKCIEGVENACAVFHQKEQKIVLFIQTKVSFIPRKFNMALKKYLQDYMLPDTLISMESLPLTPNSKINRVALKQSLENPTA